MNISLCLVACIYMTRKLGLPQKRVKTYHLLSDYRKTKQAIVEIQQEDNMALRKAHHCFHLSPKSHNIDF